MHFEFGVHLKYLSFFAVLVNEQTNDIVISEVVMFIKNMIN